MEKKMDQERVSEVMEINDSLAKLIEQELGENVYLCYQCVKCTSGCPLSNFFDWQPNQIMRAIQLGQEKIALHSFTPWLCSACQTCSTRCPQGIDINGVMEFLTREAIRRGITPPIPTVHNFNRAFLREVRIWGRMYEPGLMAEMKLREPGTLLDDFDLYVRMLRKRKVALFPKLVRPPRKAKPRVNSLSAIGYYPGCSLESTSREYDLSARLICKELGIPIIEPKDWICCGSTAAHRSNPDLALELPMTNLKLFEQMGFNEVTMPCAACYNRHQSAIYEIHHHPQKKREIEEQLNYQFQDRVRVTTLVETIYKNNGENKVRSRTRKPLNGLKIACYYGCLMTRPARITGSQHVDNPTDMDILLAAAGGQIVDWSYKTTCCGAANSLTRPDIVIQLSRNIILEAQKAGADVIAVACPLCHTNLDARQFQMGLEKPTPVLYFTQLLGIAFGLSTKAISLERNMVDPTNLLNEKNLL